MDRRKFMAGCLGLPLLAQTGGVQAQAGLTKIIFPFAAGAGGDTLCRLIAQEMAPVLQRTIVVENRTGGDGLIGIKAVKGGSSDGSMVLVTTGPPCTCCRWWRRPRASTPPGISCRCRSWRGLNSRS